MVTSYVPGGKACIEKMPELLLSPLYSRLVATSLAVTLALVTTAPWASCTDRNRASHNTLCHRECAREQQRQQGQQLQFIGSKLRFHAIFS